MPGWLFQLFKLLSVLLLSFVFCRGRCVIRYFEPFKTRPVYGFTVCVPPSSLCLVCSSTPCSCFFFFFLSLSGAGETQTPLGGLGFPLCFFILLKHSAFDPYFVLDTYTTATPRTCFFFFFFVVVARFLVRCLAFRRRRLFVFVLLFFKRESSGLTGHTPHAPCVFVPFSLSPAAHGLAPVLAVRPFFLAFCRGAILGPGRFLDSPGTPLRLFLGREAAWVLLVIFLFVVCCFSLSVLFAAAHVFLAGPSRRSRRRGPGWSRPPLGRVIPRGCVFRRGGYGRPLSSTILRLVFGSGHRDPRTVVIWRGGVYCPSQVLFHTHVLFFPCPRVLFFFFSGLRGPDWTARR